MDTLARTLGMRIHTARRKQGITSNRLAEYCRVGAVHIRKIESGAKLPSIQTFIMICNALQTSPQYLLQDSLEFDGCELQPGMYIYALILDGVEIDSKRMILTD